MTGIVVQNDPVNPGQEPYARSPVHIDLVTGTDGGAGYTATGTIIGRFTVETDATGNWSATLTPNSLITPANTYYRVSEGGAVTPIVVPPSGGPYLLSTLLATPPPTPAAPGITGIQVAVGGTVKGVRPELNLIAGTNVALTGADNPGAGSVDVTIDATGGGGGGTPASTVQPGTSYGVAPAVGADTSYAREDHQHGTPPLASSAPATAQGIGQAAAVGVATTPARADHVHPLAAAGTPGNSAVGDAASTGSASTFATSDHKHGRESFGAVSALPSFGAASANGTAATPSRSDHQHGAPALPAASTIAAGILQLDGTPADIQALGAQAAGAVGKAADAGHVHPTTGLVLASSLPLPVADGGTGASTAAAALTVLGAVASDWRDMLGVALLTAKFTESGVTYQQTPGDLVLCLCTASKTKSISSLAVWVTAGGVTASGVNALMLFDETGVLIDQTGDMSAAWSSPGMAEGALGGSHTVTVGVNYYLAFLTHFSGTSPHFAATGTAQTANFPVANGHRTAIFKSGQASVPLSIDPSSCTPNSGYFILYAR